MDKKYSVDIKDKIALTIPEASKITNIGQKTLRKLAEEETDLVFCVGRKKLFKKSLLEQWITNNYLA